jgi:hypothetical protein
MLARNSQSATGVGSAEEHRMLPASSKFGGEPDDAQGQFRRALAHWWRVAS